MPELADGQLLVRNVYMSVDPAMRGRMEPTEKHYTTNFAIGGPLDGSSVGRVMASRSDGVPGRRLRPAPAGLARLRGRRRAAATQVDAGARAAVRVARRPRARPASPPTPACAGPASCARATWCSCPRAAGAVGSAAGQFARLLGASRVIGSAGGPEKAKLLVEELGFDAGIDYRADLRGGLADAAPDGIDLYFDNVGGDHLVAALYALNVARPGGAVRDDLDDGGRLGRPGRAPPHPGRAQAAHPARLHRPRSRGPAAGVREAGRGLAAHR